MSDFNDLSLRPSLVKALELEKITIPTNVQEKSIPVFLEKKDLIVQSETGTGKTLAYLLPIFESIACGIDASENKENKENKELKELKAIVLVPTHELAVQVQRQIEKLALNSELNIRCALIIGKVNIERQIEKLREKPQIVVGSAGRVLELIKKKKIVAQTVKIIVLDEADRLMSEDNIENTLAVIKTTQKDRQLVAFSATIPDKIIEKLKGIMKLPEVLKSQNIVAVPETIKHFYKVVEKRDKIEVLRKLIRSLEPKKALIFMNNNFDIEIAYDKLNYHGLKTDCIHGTNRKGDRKKTMDDFRSGKVNNLIASDLAARGLQIEGITHVFDMTMSENAQDYLHRAGRTGRNGNEGIVISIVTEREVEMLMSHANKLNIKIDLLK